MSARVTARAGLLDVLDRPAAVLLEILWRWSFGVVAIAFAALAILRVLASAPVPEADQAEIALAADPQRVVLAMARILAQIGPYAVREGEWLLPVLSAAWLSISAFGRAATCAALDSAAKAEASGVGRLLRPCLWISFLRVIAFWCAVGLGVAAVLVASRAEPPDVENTLQLVRYYALLLPAWTLIAAAWFTVNFLLSMVPAALLGGVDEQEQRHPVRAWLRRSRPTSRDWYGVTLQFGALKTLAITVALIASVAIGGLAAILSAPITIALLCVISLIYFAIADTLFLARLAAYSRLNDTEWGDEIQLRERATD